MDLTPEILDTVPVWLSITLYHHYVMDVEERYRNPGEFQMEWEAIREYEKQHNLPPIVAPELIVTNQAWTQKEIDILIQEFDDNSAAMAKRLGRTVNAVSTKVARLRKEGKIPCISEYTNSF